MLGSHILDKVVNMTLQPLAKSLAAERRLKLAQCRFIYSYCIRAHSVFIDNFDCKNTTFLQIRKKYFVMCVKMCNFARGNQ